MSAFVIPFHNIDPIAINFGFFSIKWYGLAYAAGLLLGWLYVRKLLETEKFWPQKAPIDAKACDDLLIWVALGVILGGRLGFIFFYEPGHYLENPLDIFKVWQGGMAFHGGLLGTIIAMYLFSKRNNTSLLSIADLVAAAVPIGIFFGRIANFINGRLFGKVTDVPWAMHFPEGGNYGRHPSQLYEAALEGLILFLVLRFLIYNRNALAYPGMVSGIFLIGYAVGRSIAENFREQDLDHIFSWGPLTAGIVYSIPMAILGAYLVWNALKGKQATA